MRRDDELERTKDDDELELKNTIRQLIDRLEAARESSAEHRMILRQLTGVHDFSQLGRLIIEEYEMVARLALP